MVISSEDGNVMSQVVSFTVRHVHVMISLVAVVLRVASNVMGVLIDTHRIPPSMYARGTCHTVTSHVIDDVPCVTTN